MARHSSGRRVVAASVPTASAPAPSALAAEYQPGYDGLPGGAQGLRALRMDYDQDYDDDQDFVGFDEAIMRRQHPTPEKQQPCHFHDTHPLSEHADANVDSDVSIPLQLDGVAETSADQ